MKNMNRIANNAWRWQSFTVKHGKVILRCADR